GTPAGVTATTTAITAGTTTSVTLTLDRIVDIHSAAAFTLLLPVNVTTVGTGPINVTVATNTVGITGGTFTVGTFGTGAVTVDGTGTVGTVARFDIGAGT
ncbi:MAG: hypothetical protein M1571_10580, partial [Firmicutes bacterium]|nr:hypothetical protein [Bacillota bacterium]